MSNPYQPPKAQLGEPGSQPKGRLPLAGAIAVASAAEIALMWMVPILSAVLGSLTRSPVSLTFVVYFAIELILAGAFTYLCGSLAIRLSASKPYAAALPVGAIGSAVSSWELWGGLRTGESSLWYVLISASMPLAAAAAVAIVRSREKRNPGRHTSG